MNKGSSSKTIGYRRDSIEGTSRIMDKFNRACEEGDINQVRNLLSDVSMPNFPRKELEATSRPPLYWACKGGNLEVVKILMEKYPGCNPHFISDAGHNLLYVACARGHVRVTQFLNEVCSIKPTDPSKDGTTPIFAATYNGHFEMLKFLIYNLKCDPTRLNLKGESLLHLACDRNHLNIARYLVEEHGFDPELGSIYKKTPLHSACSSGNLSITKYLIEELNTKTDIFDETGCTPLHNACRSGYEDIVQYFIEKKCNLYLYDNSGYMPLHKACLFGRKDVVKKLLNEGRVDPNVRTVTDFTPLQIAKDNDAVIRELIRSGAKTAGMGLKIFRDYELKQPLHSIVHIFMIGHSASGKSTLVESLQQQSTHFFYIKRQTIQVKPHTAGVIPIKFDSSEFGKVLLYDFAGDYEFHPSHAALLEHSKFTSPPLFILVVNLLDKFEESKRYVS